MTTPLSSSSSDQYDDRPFISDLLTKHSVAIKSVHDTIQADDFARGIYNKPSNAKRYDDIWILRFVLSHKGSVKSASKAALNTIKFREEKKINELGDIRHRLRNYGDLDDAKRFSGESLAGWELFNSFCGENAAVQTVPDDNRGLILFCDVGQIDMDRVAEEMLEEIMTEYLIHLNEAVFQILDGITRRTGRLTKHMKLIDLGNVQLRNMNRTYLKRDGAINSMLEDYFPQLTGTVFVVNSPVWVSTFWAMLRPFFPKRMVQKIDFLPSIQKSKNKSSKKHLKPVFRYISEEHYPERYGGKNQQWPMPCAGRKYSAETSLYE